MVEPLRYHQMSYNGVPAKGAKRCPECCSARLVSRANCAGPTAKRSRLCNIAHPYHAVYLGWLRLRHAGVPNQPWVDRGCGQPPWNDIMRARCKNIEIGRASCRERV